MSPACVDELVRDGAQPVPADTDTTDWNASYGQSGGGMHSTVADMGTWAASMSGNSLLSGTQADGRLQFHDAALGPMEYGLGVIRFGNQVGHEGEAIGWEGWAGQDPATGLNAVVFTTTCADSAVVFKALGVLDPAFAPTAKVLFGE
jgi:D-alanyl-D-alanine carboxypeptidase